MIYRKVFDTTEEMAAWYDAKYREMGGVWQTPDTELSQHLVDADIQPGMKVADFGAGDGSFLSHVQAIGCSFVGYEISAVAELYALQKYGIALMPLDVGESIFLPDVPGTFDRVVSLGALEHVIDIDTALENAYSLLKPDGLWYFYVPNEKWIHEDQPNERTGTELEWYSLFRKHGLQTQGAKIWGDCTAFRGIKL